MQMIFVLLLLAAFGAMGIGFLAVSEATMGVYFAAVGLFFGVLARIAQADWLSNEERKRMAELIAEQVTVKADEKTLDQKLAEAGERMKRVSRSDE